MLWILNFVSLFICFPKCLRIALVCTVRAEYIYMFYAILTIYGHHFSILNYNWLVVVVETGLVLCEVRTEFLCNCQTPVTVYETVYVAHFFVGPNLWSGKWILCLNSEPRYITVSVRRFQPQEGGRPLIWPTLFCFTWFSYARNLQVRSKFEHIIGSLSKVLVGI